MKRHILTIAILASTLCPLAACKTTLQDGPRKVTIEDDEHHKSSTFCPPGQAKKGNC